MSTPIVEVRLGAKWEEAPGKEHKDGDKVLVDAVRAQWLVENIKRTRIVSGEEVEPMASWTSATPEEEKEVAIPQQVLETVVTPEPESKKKGKR